ncbi:MAG: hypothetical protein N2D54_12970, partial [Chloroflexota bacterium]
MAEVLRFFGQYEFTLYFILGMGIIVYAVRFWAAWQETRTAIFGLEQTNSRRRLNQAAIAIFVMLTMGFIVFILVTFVSPVIEPEIILPISSPIPDASLLTPEALAGGETSTPDVLSTATLLPTVVVETEGCMPDELEISSPGPGDTLRGEIPVEGTVNIPNLAFYKFEVAEANQELWLTIQAGRTLVEDGFLVENWDTSLIPP